MIAKEVRTLTNMCSSAYDLLTMLERGGQPPSSAMVALNQMTTGNQGKRRIRRRNFNKYDSLLLIIMDKLISLAIFFCIIKCIVVKK
jgi:hypothetical protein